MNGPPPVKLDDYRRTHAALRAGLAALSQQAEVPPLTAERLRSIHTRAARRSTLRISAVAAAVIAVVAFPGLIVTGVLPLPGFNQGQAGPFIATGQAEEPPDGFRWELYEHLRVAVPSDWERLETADPAPCPTTPYVEVILSGQPAASSCGDPAVAAPVTRLTITAVADALPAAPTADGWRQTSRVVAGLRLSITHAADQVDLARTILDSATVV